MDCIASEMPGVGIDGDHLLARCRAGDVDAFEAVYSRWERPLFRYAYWMLGDADDADDVKQETFIRAFRTIGRFDGRCGLPTWLFGICGNLCRDTLKRRRRRPEIPLNPSVSCASGAAAYADPLQTVLSGEHEEMIVQALQSLAPRHRELILLREVEGLSYEEIGLVLRCSLASVKLRLFRARRQWRKHYNAMEREGDPPC